MQCCFLDVRLYQRLPSHTMRDGASHGAHRFRSALVIVGASNDAENRNVARVFTDRKDYHWGKRKLARDR
jgi:hypothetical protein